MKAVILGYSLMDDIKTLRIWEMPGFTKNNQIKCKFTNQTFDIT